MTVDEIVDAFKAQFDTNDATALRILNLRQAVMVADALFRAVEKTITTTVAGQDLYDVATDVVDLKVIYIGTTRYDPVGQEDLRRLLDPDDPASLTGPGGVFSEAYKADGTPQVRIYPAPDTTGDNITGLEALQPATLVAGGTLLIPADLHGYLYDGMLAEGYAQLDERPDLASYHDSRFEAGVLKLKKRRIARVGGGVRGMQVKVG